MSITIKYGAGNSVNMDADRYATVAELLEDRNLQATLGASDNVEVLVDGVTLDSSDAIEDGETYMLIPRATKKG